MTQSNTRGVDDDEDDSSVIDIEESDNESYGGVYPRIKQETIKVEDVSENDDEDNPPSLAERDSLTPMESLGIVKIVRVPRWMLIPTMKGKHHYERVYEEVGFPHIKSIRVECETDRTKNQFAGNGYSTKQGVVN